MLLRAKAVRHSSRNARIGPAPRQWAFSSTKATERAYSSFANWLIEQNRIAMAEFKLNRSRPTRGPRQVGDPGFSALKWQTPDIRKLLESLRLDFPIGASLLWRTQRGMLEFRRIEDVEFSDGEENESAISETHERRILG
jgi:hypothetical protein